MGISGYAQLAQFDTGDQALVKKATPIEVENLSPQNSPPVYRMFTITVYSAGAERRLCLHPRTSLP